MSSRPSQSASESSENPNADEWKEWKECVGLHNLDNEENFFKLLEKSGVSNVRLSGKNNVSRLSGTQWKTTQLNGDEVNKAEMTLQLILTFGKLIGYPTIALTALLTGYNFYQLCAMIVTYMGSMFWSLFFYTAFTAPRLSSVTISRKRSSVIESVFLNDKFEWDHSKPVGSISELIGIRGSSTEKLSSSMIYSITSITTTLFLLKMYQQYHDTGALVGDGIWICGLLASFGLWSIPTWELYDGGISHVMHFGAVFIYASGVFLGYMIQESFSASSIGLCITCLVTAVSWFYAQKYKVLGSSYFGTYNTGVICISMEAAALILSMYLMVQVIYALPPPL